MIRISGWRVVVAAAALTLAGVNASAATITLDLTASPQGLTGQNLGTAANTWFWTSAGWQVNGPGNNASLQRLLTPVFTADSASFGLVLTHRFNFETAFDGGQVLVSVNGGAFTLLGTLGTPYTHTLSSIFGNPRGGQPAFSGTSAGYATPAFISSSFSGATAPGTTLQFAFDGAWDVSFSQANPNWHLTNVELRDFVDPNAPAVPEPSTWLLLGTGLGAMVARRRLTNRA